MAASKATTTTDKTTSSKNPADGKSKALETTIASLTKRYGEGTVMKMGDATELHIDSIPTGALSLDLALGIGGVPRGRVIEIYGPESSGKTTLCLSLIHI